MNNILFRRAGRLFAKPSFLEGYARSIDIGATLNEYNVNKTMDEADAEAILSDWFAVGDSINDAMNSESNK